MSRARSLAAGIAYGAFALVGFLVVLPVVMGWRPLTVMSGSMEPAIATGDVVVTRPIAATAIRSGQVITFRDPDDPSRLLTHRVRRAVRDGARVDVVTQGDANTGVERWSVDEGGRVGFVGYRLPYVGFVLHPAQSAPGRLVLIGLPVSIWGALVLRDIWRREPAPVVAHA